MSKLAIAALGKFIWKFSPAHLGNLNVGYRESQIFGILWLIIMHEREDMFTYQVIGDDDMRSAHRYGTGEFDNFVREQKLEISQRIRDLRENPPSRFKHGGRFKSILEMRNAYAGRDRAIEQLENKLSFLKNEGNSNRAMLLRYDDEGNISGFEVVEI